MTGEPGRSRRRRLKILFYAINGTGLGHLQRLLSVARPLRDLVTAFGGRVDIQIVTTSDAPSVAWDFPVYKLPSKSTVRKQGGPVEDFQRIARLTLIQLAASFRPDLLVLDTVPEGAFHELLVLRDHAVLTAFIDRRRDLKTAVSKVHQSHLALYDLVLVPDYEHRAQHYPMDLQLQSRRRFVGPIHGWSAHRAWSREEVRRRLAVPEDRRVVYLSAGGGGDRRARDQMEALVRVLADDPRFFLLLGYGPLFRGPLLYGPHRIPFTGAEVGRYFLGVDVAISAAGYNTFQELLAAEVPTAFFAQAKGLDRQDERISEGLGSGFHLELPDFQSETIRNTVDRLTEPDVVTSIRGRLSTRPVADGALRAASELLRAAVENGRGGMDRGEIPLAEQWLGHWAEVVARERERDPTQAQDDISFTGACRPVLEAAGFAGRLNRLYDLALVARETGQPSPGWTAQVLELLTWGLRMDRFFNELEASNADRRRWLKLVFSAVESEHGWLARLQLFEDLSNHGAPVGGLLRALDETLHRKQAWPCLQAVLEALGEGSVGPADLAAAFEHSEEHNEEHSEGPLSIDDVQHILGSTARSLGDASP